MSAIADLHCSSGPWRGKRATLDVLQGRLQHALIPCGFGIDPTRWRERREDTLDLVTRRFGDALLAVRSDRADEDVVHTSNAGRYSTCLDIRAADRLAVSNAIDAVFASYAPPHVRDEVFVQRQVTRVRNACVAFTHALPDGAPYYVVSLAPGPRSDHVTRGDADVHSWYLARDEVRTDMLSDDSRACLRALREIESVLGMQPCEIEIVLDDDGVAWLLQARPLRVPECDNDALSDLRRATEARLASQPLSPLLGMMPDWNPAELIGEHPRPLARTLFDRLITRRAWRIGRAALGYADIGEHALLQVHAGRPYVDARMSFRSLLPTGLDRALGERLVEGWCERLRAHPELHDKIEFDLVCSSLTCGMEQRFVAHHPSLLDATARVAFAAALHRPTAAALDRALTERLLDGFRRDLQLATPASEPQRLRHWLERLELRTAVRFAKVARQAFAVEALLRSAVDIGALDAHWLDTARQCATDTARAAYHGSQGHVRAGTFEIAAPARREMAARAFISPYEQVTRSAGSPSLDPAASNRLHCALDEIGLDIAPDALLAHHARLLHAREFGKFVLARAVSLALDALAARARVFGLERDDAGWLDLQDLLNGSADAHALRARVGAARALHALESQLRMPLLLDGCRLDSIHHAPGQANFLGRGRADGRTTLVDAHTHPDSVPVHAIIAIASANPGFDWIFVRQPAALLTAFGGPNSHMAIRCAEAGVPALLGVGPEAFRRIAAAGRIAIDFDCRTWTTA